jgi:hypothetical protein
MPRRDESSDGDGLCDRCWWSLFIFFIIFLQPSSRSSLFLTAFHSLWRLQLEQ